LLVVIMNKAKQISLLVMWQEIFMMQFTCLMQLPYLRQL